MVRRIVEIGRRGGVGQMGELASDASPWLFQQFYSPSIAASQREGTSASGALHPAFSQTETSHCRRRPRRPRLYKITHHQGTAQRFIHRSHRRRTAFGRAGADQAQKIERPNYGKAQNHSPSFNKTTHPQTVIFPETLGLQGSPQVERRLNKITHHLCLLTISLTLRR